MSIISWALGASFDRRAFFCRFWYIKNFHVLKLKLILNVLVEEIEN